MNFDNEQMAESPATQSVRLILEYDGDKIRLVSQQAVNVEPPITDPTTPTAEKMGFSVEVRDDNLRVLHRQVMHDPTITHPEVFSNEPGKTIARSAKPVKKGAFTVLVPAIAAGDHVAFIRKTPETKLKAATAPGAQPGEIARFSLKAKPAAAPKPKKKSPTGSKKKSPKEKRK